MKHLRKLSLLAVILIAVSFAIAAVTITYEFPQPSDNQTAQTYQSAGVASSTYTFTFVRPITLWGLSFGVSATDTVGVTNVIVSRSYDGVNFVTIAGDTIIGTVVLSSAGTPSVGGIVKVEPFAQIYKFKVTTGSTIDVTSVPTMTFSAGQAFMYKR